MILDSMNSHIKKPSLGRGLADLLGQAQAQAFRNGFFDQSSQLWNEAGVLLVTTHQIVYYKQ